MNLVKNADSDSVDGGADILNFQQASGDANTPMMQYIFPCICQKWNLKLQAIDTEITFM